MSECFERPVESRLRRILRPTVCRTWRTDCLWLSSVADAAAFLTAKADQNMNQPTSAPGPEPRLVLAGITKQYAGVVANDGVSLSVRLEGGRSQSSQAPRAWANRHLNERRIRRQGKPACGSAPFAALRTGHGAGLSGQRLEHRTAGRANRYPTVARHLLKSFGYARGS